mmetsp:Transcript_28440/g.67302  ORF Transcript_28440/g.67302 Transcript_28440/m.67302 type:complete len:88 (+) Transcript_28440:38-301(+)
MTDQGHFLVQLWGGPLHHLNATFFPSGQGPVANIGSIDDHRITVVLNDDGCPEMMVHGVLVPVIHQWTALQYSDWHETIVTYWRDGP